MRFMNLLPFPVLIAALIMTTGCDDFMTRGDVPDNTPETQRAVNKVNADALVKKHDIDVAYQDQDTAIAFQEKLIRDNAAQQDVEVDIARDKVAQPLKIKIMKINAQAKTDKEAVEFEASQRLKNPGDLESAIKAERVSRCAEIDLKATESIAAVNFDMDQATLRAQQQHFRISQDKDKQLADKRMELEADERVARQKKSDIDKETIEKLNAISQKSADTTAQTRKADQRVRDSDMKITQAIRDDLANDRNLSALGKDIDITTTNGVVVMSGTVDNESDRQSVIAKAKKVDGVVRVDNLLAVK
jgi:osmotically-inducible protein OsmY